MNTRPAKFKEVLVGENFTLPGYVHVWKKVSEERATCSSVFMDSGGDRFYPNEGVNVIENEVQL